MGAGCAVVLLSNCGEVEPEETEGFDSRVVVDGETFTPTTVGILAAPGGGEIALGKTLLVVMTIGDDDEVFMDLPSPEIGTFELTAYGSPSVYFDWQGTRYEATSGTVEISEAGRRTEERLRVVVRDLVVVDACGTATLDVGEIVIAGEVEETFDERFTVANKHGFVDTTFRYADRDVRHLGRFIGSRAVFGAGPVLDARSLDTCTIDNLVTLVVLENEPAGTYQFRASGDGNVQLFVVDEDDLIHYASAGTAVLDSAGSTEAGAELRVSLSGVSFTDANGNPGVVSMDDTSFLVVNNPLE